MISLEAKTCSCTQKCRVTQYANTLIALLTKTSDTQLLLSEMCKYYFNCHRIVDNYGRHLINMAAACGRSEVIDWLIKYRKADLSVKTLENGWTSLHCAAFYGQIGAFLTLIKNGANLNIYDNDKLIPIEHFAIDKWDVYKNSDLNNINEFDCYSWGSNINFTLGHSNELERTHAELIELFKKSNISIEQVVMSKFHTLFRDLNGRVYSCGHGKDGRLGHDNEETYMLPTLIESLKHDECVYMAASRNNSYFLLKDGSVKSCGTNEFKQLGQINIEKSITPKSFNMKTVKSLKIQKIECGRFHCVFLSEENDVYTFGLNAGQLGHLKETSSSSNVNYIQDARLVKELAKLQLKFHLISCSDGATICLDQKSKRIVYLLNDYKCKRLPIVNYTIEKLRVYGGKLDYQANSDILGPELGDSVKIVCLTNANTLIMWNEDGLSSNDQFQWKQLCWNHNKKLRITDFDLNKNGVIISTVEGLCYIIDFEKFKLIKQSISFHSAGQQRVRSANSNDFNDTNEAVSKIELYDLTQIAFVNRAFKVFNDPKGRNYCALQYTPHLYMKFYPKQETSLFKDEIYEYYMEINQQQPVDIGNTTIMFQYRTRKFYLNRYILQTRCDKFYSKFNLDKINELNLDEMLNRGSNSSKYDVKLVEMLFSFIYSNQYKQFYELFKFHNIQTISQLVKLIKIFKDLCEKFYLTDLKHLFDNITKNLESNDDQLVSKHDNQQHSNHHQTQQQLQLNKFVNLIELLIKKYIRTNAKLRFSRLDYDYLHDCIIKCNQNQTINCHKCVLIARCDYFRNMFLGYWLESNLNEIVLPFDYDLLLIIIDYLYTDDIIINFGDTATTTTSSANNIDKEIEILFNLYILSDQLLLNRTKNLCEVKLANLINFKNSIEMLQFSRDYNAKQLSEFCMEFICNNLTTFIELKYLENNYNLEMLNDLTRFYKQYFNHVMDKRVITPYDIDNKLIDVNSIDLIPLELINNEKFIENVLPACDYDSTAAVAMFNDSDVGLNLNNKQRKFTHIVNNSPTNAIISNEDIVDDKNPLESVQEMSKKSKNESDENTKWEKVRKKNRKKPNETEKEKSQPVCSSSVVVGAFFNEKDVLKYEKAKETQKQPLQQQKIVVKNEKLNSNEKPLVKSNPIETPAIKSTNTVSSPKINKASPWGVVVDTTKSPSSHTLFDIINEEMSKLSVTKTKTEPVAQQPKTIESIVVNSPPRGWNIPTQTQTASKTPMNSISQIIEMEKNYIAQYHKFTNRNMDLIQLEEKAIDDLRRLYAADDSSDMRITVELVQDTDINILSKCAPAWKK